MSDADIFTWVAGLCLGFRPSGRGHCMNCGYQEHEHHWQSYDCAHDRHGPDGCIGRFGWTYNPVRRKGGPVAVCRCWCHDLSDLRWYCL